MNVPATAPTEDERTWGMYAHLSGMLAYSGIPFGGVIGPAIVYANTKQRPFANAQARAALNFHITIGILQFIFIAVGIFGYIPLLASAMSDVPGTATNWAWALFFPLGLVAYFLLYAFSFVMTLINTIRASNGVLAGYPFTIRFFSQ